MVCLCPFLPPDSQQHDIVIFRCPLLRYPSASPPEESRGCNIRSLEDSVSRIPKSCLKGFRERPPGLLQHVLTVLVCWSWVLLQPRLPPSSRSLRLFPWASTLLYGPLDIAWICCPQLLHHPCKNGTHSTCFYSTGGRTPIFATGELRKGPPFLISWVAKLGDREPCTIPTKDLSHRVVCLGGWCANCRKLRKRQNTHDPQFCTRDVDRRFCGGAWISRSDIGDENVT